MNHKIKNQHVVPPRRFPAFRDAAGWEICCLKDIANFYKGKNLPKSSIIPKGSKKCIHYGELFTKYSEVITSITSRTNQDACFYSVSNDVLMPTSDVTPNGLAKASCINLDGIVLGGDILVVRTDSSAINGIFLARYIRRKKEQVLQLVTGTTVYHLYPSAIGKLSISLPNIEEQQKIADCLSSLDALIAAQGKKLEALKKHKKGLMQQLFPAPGETLPPRRFPAFRDAAGWEEKRLSTIATVIAGQSPSSNNYNDRSLGTPFYQGKTDFGDTYLNKPTKWTNKITKEANTGDILMSVRAPVGALNISTDKICIGRGLASIQTTQNKWYLYYFLHHIQKLIVGNGGSIFDSINKEQINRLNIFIPASQLEQQKIADCLSSLDALIAAQGKKLEALKKHKKGLMQQLFPRR